MFYVYKTKNYMGNLGKLRKCRGRSISNETEVLGLCFLLSCVNTKRCGQRGLVVGFNLVLRLVSADIHNDSEPDALMLYAKAVH